MLLSTAALTPLLAASYEWASADIRYVSGTVSMRAYTPSLGTVSCFGYGAQMTEPRPFTLDGLRGTNDAFFLKASYLFRK